MAAASAAARGLVRIENPPKLCTMLARNRGRWQAPGLPGAAGERLRSALQEVAKIARHLAAVGGAGKRGDGGVDHLVGSPAAAQFGKGERVVVFELRVRLETHRRTVAIGEPGNGR